MNDLFDFYQLDELMSADPDELRQVLWDLFKDFGESVSALPGKLDRLNEIAMEAHQLRGVSSSFGLKKLAERAKDLENTANQGDQQTVIRLITEVQQLLKLSEDELRKARPEYFVPPLRF